MTTGSRVVDLRSPVATSCGAAMPGSYYSKTWSGTDSPSTRRSFSYVSKYRLLKGPPDKSGYPKYRVTQRLARDKPPRRSANVDHPYSANWISYFDPILKWNFSPSPLSLTGTVLSCFGGVSITGSAWNSTDDLALLGKLREKVAGSSFNAGVFLGEGKQACQLIADAAIRVAGAYSAARRGNFQRASNILTAGKGRGFNKTSASNWLELQYGWLPLLNDAHDGAQFLAQQFSVPLQYNIRVHRQRSFIPKIGSCTFASAEGQTRGQLIARLSEVDVVQLAGLKDPASIAWELLPYSFVIDWFIPIGNYLAARGLAQALTGTFVQSITLKYRLSNCSAFGPGYFGSSPSFRYEGGSLVRTLSSSLSIPKPEIKGFEKTASWAHAANAVALLVGRIPR